MMDRITAEAIIENAIVGEWGKAIPKPAKDLFVEMIQTHGERAFMASLASYQEREGDASKQPTPRSLRPYLEGSSSTNQAHLHWFDPYTGETSKGFFDRRIEPDAWTADWLFGIAVSEIHQGRITHSPSQKRLLDTLGGVGFWSAKHQSTGRTHSEIWHEALVTGKAVATEKAKRQASEQERYREAGTLLAEQIKAKAEALKS